MFINRGLVFYLHSGEATHLCLENLETIVKLALLSEMIRFFMLCYKDKFYIPVYNSEGF
jgi:hypothetical protein